MISFLITFIQLATRLFMILVIVKIFLSYFLSPYHQVRMVVDRIVEPFQAPIRRIVPTVGMFDFSPLVLIILIQVIEFVLISLLVSLR
jgi:YggT family protein